MKRQRNQKSQNNFENEQSGRLTLPALRLTYPATVIKTVQCGQRDRRLGHGTERSPDIDRHKDLPTDL